MDPIHSPKGLNSEIIIGERIFKISLLELSIAAKRIELCLIRPLISANDCVAAEKSQLPNQPARAGRYCHPRIFVGASSKS